MASEGGTTAQHVPFATPHLPAACVRRPAGRGLPVRSGRQSVPAGGAVATVAALPCPGLTTLAGGAALPAALS